MMRDYNDKSETFEFKPMREEKPQLNRRENDVYSSARRSVQHKKEDEGNNRTLVYVAIILAVLLIASLIAGIFILKSGKNEENTPPVEENLIIGEDEEEEEPEENKEIVVECSMIFYADSVIKKNGEYTVLADLYDKNFYKFDNRKLVITKDTLIKEDGKRLSMDALIYLVESMAGEGIVFEGEIRDEDNVVLSISFDGSFREEIEEEPQTPEEEPILPGEEPQINQEPQMGETQESETQPLQQQDNQSSDTQN